MTARTATTTASIAFAIALVGSGCSTLGPTTTCTDPNATVIRQTAATGVTTVAVRGDRGQGNGVVLGRERVLTVAHLVSRSGTTWVSAQGSGWVPARAVLEVPGYPESLVVLEVEAGEGWFASLFGFTGFDDVTCRSAAWGNHPSELVTCAGLKAWGTPLVPGDSGGAVVDEHDQLLGLLSGRTRTGQGVYVPVRDAGALAATQLSPVVIP